MKKLIKYLLICNITIILFVILNILISYLWIFYNNFKYESKNPFSKEVRKSFALSNSDQSILHKNTYDLKYEYAPYLGAVPKNYKSKFVNYDKETGRYISNAEPCVNNIFFFWRINNIWLVK